MVTNIRESGRPGKYLRFQVVLLLTIMTFVMLWGCVIVNEPLLTDQTLILVVAQLLEDGYVLYRDVWNTNTPGNFISYYLALQVFGDSPRSVYWLDIVVRLATLLALYFLIKRVEDSDTALIGATVFGVISTFYWSTPQWVSEKDIFMTLFLLLAMHAFMKYRGSPGLRPWFSVGALVGLGTLMKPVAAATYLYLVIVVVLDAYTDRRKGMDPLKAIAGMGVGLIATWLPIVVYEFLHGGLGNMWGDTVLFNAYFSKFPRPMSSIADYLRLGERVFNNFQLNYRPLYLLTLLGVVCILNDKRLRSYNLILGWIPFVMLGIIVQRKFFPHHWAALLAPCVPLIAYGARSLLETVFHADARHIRSYAILLGGCGVFFYYEPSWRPYVLGVVTVAGVCLLLRRVNPQRYRYKKQWASTALITLLLVVTTHQRLSPSYERSWKTILSAFGPPPKVDTYFPSYVELVEFLDTRLPPSEKILVWGWGINSSIYCLSDRKAPTTFLYDAPLNFTYPERDEPPYFKRYKERNRAQFLSEIKSDPPGSVIVVFNDRGWVLDDSRSELGQFPEFSEFLKKHYELARRINGKEIYLRKSSFLLSPLDPHDAEP